MFDLWRRFEAVDQFVYLTHGLSFYHFMDLERPQNPWGHYSRLSAYRSSLMLVQLLHDAGYLDEDTVALLEKLISIGNVAVHDRWTAIDPQDAKRYSLLTADLVQRLKGIAGERK